MIVKLSELLDHPEMVEWLRMGKETRILVIDDEDAELVCMITRPGVVVGKWRRNRDKLSGDYPWDTLGLT